MLPGFLAVKVPSLLQYCERNTSLKNQSFEEFTFVPVSLMSRKISDIVGVSYVRYGFVAEREWIFSSV